MNWTRLLLTGIIPVSSLVYFNTRIFKVAWLNVFCICILCLYLYFVFVFCICICICIWSPLWSTSTTAYLRSPAWDHVFLFGLHQPYFWCYIHVQSDGHNICSTMDNRWKVWFKADNKKWMDIFTALFSGDKVCPCESKPEQQDEQRDELGRRSHRYCHRVSSLSFSQVMIVDDRRCDGFQRL